MKKVIAVLLVIGSFAVVGYEATRTKYTRKALKVEKGIVTISIYDQLYQFKNSSVGKGDTVKVKIGNTKDDMREWQIVDSEVVRKAN